MESNDSPEIPDRGEISDIPGLPSGVIKENRLMRMEVGEEQVYLPRNPNVCSKSIKDGNTRCGEVVLARAGLPTDLTHPIPPIPTKVS